MIIKDVDGKEIEVFTADDVAARETTAREAAGKQAVEDYKKNNPDKSGEVTKLQTDLDEANRKLKDAEDAGDKGSGQVERLRRERDEAQNKLNTQVSDLSKRIDDLIGDTKGELLNKLAGADVELRKKLELEFDNYRPGANSKTDIIERVQKAYQLVTGNKPTPGMLDNLSGAGQRGDGSAHIINNEHQKKEFNPNEVAIGNMLGITEEDRKKHPKGSVNSGTAN